MTEETGRCIACKQTKPKSELANVRMAAASDRGSARQTTVEYCKSSKQCEDAAIQEIQKRLVS